MKKILYSVMVLAIAAMTFTACEDVPEPYPTPTPSNVNTEIEGAEGDGSLANPFNAIAATNAAKELGSGNVSEQAYYIKGKVVSIATDKNGNVLNFDQGTYGNASFYISDDGTSTNQFYCYRVLYLGNKKWTQGAGDILKVGDEVIVCAKITMYNTTPETQQNEGFLYSLNGKSEGGGGSEETGTATGDGTLANPYNSVAAIAYAKSVGDTESDKDVYIKGKVASITEQYGTQFGNATFTISDDGTSTNAFTVYRALYLGNAKYTSGDLLNEKDEVIVCGKVTCFKGNTPETVQGKAYLYSLNGKTEGSGNGDTPQPGGDAKAVTIAEFNDAAESTDVWYQLTGTVKNLKDGDQYGNFDLEDETGSVYVYGLLSEKGGQKKKFQELVAAKGIKEDCKLTIIGNRGSYNGKIEVTNAYFVSIEGGDTPGGGSGGGSGTAASELTNGDFETWADGLPTGWKSASTASSATLAQSTDAHGGNYSCNVNGKESSNVRLACQEITLAAGTYVFSFYAKATTADVAQVRPGYVPVTDGKVGNYAYGDYANISNTSWTQVTHEFTLSAETTLCLVVMNPKKSSYSSGKDVLVDDATLTKK